MLKGQVAWTHLLQQQLAKQDLKLALIVRHFG